MQSAPPSLFQNPIPGDWYIMFNQLSHQINIGKLKDLQVLQHVNVLKAEVSVPAVAAGGSAAVTVNVSNEGDFICQDITGSFSTLAISAAPPAGLDDGVNYLSVKIRDTGNGTDLFDDFVPLNLFLSPGRIRTAGIIIAPAGLAVEPSNQIFFPKRFSYVFEANTNILIEARNTSTFANTFTMAFWGIRVKSPNAVSGIRAASKGLSDRAKQ